MCLSVVSAVGILVNESRYFQKFALTANAALWAGVIYGFIVKRKDGIVEGVIGGLLVALLLLTVVLCFDIHVP